MKFKDLFMYIVGSLVIIGLFILVYILVFVEVPEQNENILYMIAGLIGGSFVTVVAYYFGSSNGSKIKTDIIKNGIKIKGHPHGDDDEDDKP
jgi:uncharacterized membrane protein